MAEAGIDKLVLTTQDYKQKHKLGWIYQPPSFKVTEEGEQAQGTGKWYMNTETFNASISEKGLLIVLNPSKPFHPYQLCSEQEKLKERTQNALNEVRGAGLEFSIDELKVSRIDISRNELMKQPFADYIPAMSLLNMAREKRQATYPSGRMIGNNQRGLIIYVPAAGFHLDRIERTAALVDEIHFVLTIAPIGEFTRLLRKLCTDCQLEGAPALLCVGHHVHACGHAVQRRAGGQHLGAGAAAEPGLGGVLLQGVHEERAAVQLDVGLHQIGVAPVLQLPQQFGVADLLRRVLAQDLEGLPEQGGFAHAALLQDVLADHGLDDGILHVGVPAVRVVLEGHGAGVATVRQVARQVVAEGLLEFGKGPVVHPQEFEAAGKAFGHPCLNLQRAGTQQHHAQEPGLGIPQRLEGFGPVRHLLDLVDHQQAALAQQQGLLPVLP